MTYVICIKLHVKKIGIKLASLGSTTTLDAMSRSGWLELIKIKIYFTNYIQIKYVIHIINVGTLVDIVY